jgi:hypothetical protein
MARVLGTTMASLLLIWAGVAPSPAGAASAGQLLAGPTTGLVDGQAVLVTGTGFAPDTTLHFYECRIFSGCVSIGASAVTDGSGGLATIVHVRRGLDDNGTPVDCTVTQCFLAVSTSTAAASAGWGDMVSLHPPESTSVWLSFAPQASVSVVANRRLVDGQTVTVEGRGFVPGQNVYAFECTGSPCTELLPGSDVADHDGRVSITTTIRRWVDDWAPAAGDLPYDCSVHRCDLTLGLRGDYEDNDELLASTRLNFAPTPAIFTTGTGTWEGDTGSHPVDVRFGVTPSSDRPQVVRYRTYSWTATAADFQPIEGTVIVPAGATKGAVTVQVRGDTEAEPDEVFLVELRGIRRLTKAVGVAAVVIHDVSDG